MTANSTDSNVPSENRVKACAPMLLDSRSPSTPSQINSTGTPTMAKKPINARLSPVTIDAGQMPSDATVPSTYPTKPAKPTSTVSTLAAALRGPRSRVATMIISSTTNARKGQTARMCDFVTKVHPSPSPGT